MRVLVEFEIVRDTVLFVPPFRSDLVRSLTVGAVRQMAQEMTAWADSLGVQVEPMALPETAGTEE